jgi:MFS family permease
MGGLSTSAIYISGCALVLEAVGTAHVAEWMGWVGASLCVSSMLGPLLGGSVFEKWGYDAVFYVLMGLMAGDLVLRAVMVEPSQAREYLEANGTIEFENKGIVRLDKSSGFSSQSEPEDEKVPKMTTTEVSLNTDPERGAPVVPTTTTKPVALVLLSSRRTWLAIWNTFTLAALFTTFEAVLPLYVSAIWSWTALFAGLIFLPLTLPALFAPLLGRVVDRLGTRWFVFAGFLALCPLTALLRFVTHDTTAHKALLCVLLTLIGVCTAVVLDPLFGEYVAVLKDMGLVETRKGAGFAEAYGLFNAAWAAGVMGSMGAGLMYNSYGWAVMAVVMGGWCGVTALLGLIPQPSYRVDAKSST